MVPLDPMGSSTAKPHVIRYLRASVVCARVFMCTCVCARVCASVCTRVCTRVCTCMCTCVCTCVCTRVYVYMCVCMCACVFIKVRGGGGDKMETLMYQLRLHTSLTVQAGQTLLYQLRLHISIPACPFAAASCSAEVPYAVFWERSAPQDAKTSSAAVIPAPAATWTGLCGGVGVGVGRW